MMKRLTLLILSLILSIGFADFAHAKTIDRIVAVVNDEAITQSELDALLVPIYEQYKTAYSGEEFALKINEARTNLLNQLIEDRLVAQEAEHLGIEISEDEIDGHIEEVKKKFSDESEFRNFLLQQGITMAKMRRRYREQIAIRKLHQYEVRQKVVVSPLDIEQYYNDHLDEYTEKEKLKVQTIMIRKKKDDAESESAIDEARQRMEKILEELHAGASFSELAKQYSEGMHAEEGGTLGFVTRGEMIPEFDETLFTLSVGELSPVLETEIGYHIFYTEAKQEKKVQLLAEVKDEIEHIIFRTKSKERFEKWMKELKENAYISIK